MSRRFVLLFSCALTLGVLAPVQSAASSLDGTVDLSVETADRATGTVHRINATITGVTLLGQVIDFEFTGPGDTDAGAFAPEDATCTTDAAGACSVTRSATGEGAMTVRGWHQDSGAAPCNPAAPLPSDDCDTSEAQDETATPGDAEPDDTDVIAINWFDPVLNLEPETVTTPVGVQQTLTVTVLELNPPTPPAKTLLANVDVEITAGPNMNLNAAGADFECDTAQNTGSCTVSYTGGTAVGADSARAHIDNNDNGINPPATGPAGDEVPGEADATEGQNEATTPGGTAEPDRTDVVTITRSTGAAPPPPPPAPPGPPGPPGPTGCNTIAGDNGNDKLRGTAGCDIIKGKGGNDVLRGQGGRDRLIGGPGDDVAKGGGGKDRCKAETEKSC